MDMIQRRIWNENHKKMKEIICKPDKHSKAVQLFLTQHSLVHSSSISTTNQTTLEDSLLSNLKEAIFREYPVSNPDTKNSIAWHLWHITRIEDMTTNILIANEQQVLDTSQYSDSMSIPFKHSGNDMSEEEIALLSSNIDFESLLTYRRAVGIRTREIVSSLTPGDFNLDIDQNKIQRLFKENAVMEKSKWLADYWSKKNIAGLLLMPATRHNFLHLNKSVRIKEKLLKRREG
ncbi:DinB family protein [Robertmurraya yapensis]|uniref:DinB family protein n=2 Tax=Bacillaceae TaxID=186817 RepID=A0A431WEU2_9BACI|nr:DinB family protein [Bacillus yapensis]RTR34043.1 DinB family protein [Bacillus yapensis]TKS97361.1 DinB family protein [Bacillus yapensis]